MSHFSPVPPGERTYARNYRRELQHLEALLVEVSGRVKEFRDHPERSDLQSLLLVNISVTPLPRGRPKRAIKLTHLWVLTKHLVRAGVEPRRNRRVTFVGSVYAYYRLGGKSRERGLHGSHDFSILPMGQAEIETFTPGLESRYIASETAHEIEDERPNRGAAGRGQGRRGEVGEGAPGRPAHGDH